jgi:hypothetical protein
VNERTAFKLWSITGNRLIDFDDGIRVMPLKVGVTLAHGQIDGNLFATMHELPRGIWLVGPTTSPQSGFIDDLEVNANGFSCGFRSTPWFWPPVLPTNALVKPSGQPFTGNIGTLVSCPPPDPVPNPLPVPIEPSIIKQP